MRGPITDTRPASRPTEERPFDIVAIAASLGGVAALGILLGALAPDFPLPILICQHVRRNRPSLLPAILARQTGLRVVAASDGALPVAGTVHVAPSSCHLLVRADGRLGLSLAEPVNFCRPSADMLFRSIAEMHTDRAIAVVLTGRGLDGAQGVGAIRRRGGFAIAQDEASSEVFEMPLAARDIGQADLVLPLRQIPDALQLLASSSDDMVPMDGGHRVGVTRVPREVGTAF